MLSMCSLVCRLVRGWKQSEATSLISQAATTPGSSLLLHDLSEPDLNVEIGSYVASPYPQIDVLLQPYKYMRRDSYSNHGSQQHMHSAFCQTLSWQEGAAAAPCPSVAGVCPQQQHSPHHTASLFCQRGCKGAEEGEMGDCGGLLHPPPPPCMQVLWCDNNRQASLVTPRQTVDLNRWTLFFACEDDPVEHTISVPSVTTTPPHPSSAVNLPSVDTVLKLKPTPPSLTLIPEMQESAEMSAADLATSFAQSPQSSMGKDCQIQFDNPHVDSNGGHSLISPASHSSTDILSVARTNQQPLTHFPDDSMIISLPLSSAKLNDSGLKTTSVSHGFGVRARAGSTGSNGSRNSSGFCDNGASIGKIMPLGGSNVSYDGVGDGGEKITILLEARYNACSSKSKEDDWKTPVMAEQVCEPYAWKCRGVFGVIAHTTPRRLMLMVDAFFANNLLLDNDLHVTKILTVDCMGTPGRMTEPSSIAECVTPGGYYMAARQHQHGSLLDAARCLSASSNTTTPEGSTIILSTSTPRL